MSVRILLDQTASILSLDRNYLGALPESQFISPGWEIKEKNTHPGKVNHTCSRRMRPLTYSTAQS